jgi:hypothetical protein
MTPYYLDVSHSMNHIIVSLLIILCAGCNNGRPIVSPRLDVIIEQDFVLGFTDYLPKSSSVPHGTSRNDQACPGIDFSGCGWETIVIPLAIIGVVAGVNEVIDISKHESKVGIDRKLLLKIGNIGKEYDFTYGLNKLKLNDQDIANIRRNGVILVFRVNGILYGSKLVQLPPIRNPATCVILLSGDGHYYIDGYPVE